MNHSSYTPPKKILERYSDVLVNFALNGGKGIKKGEVVHLVCYEAAKPLFMELKRAIIKAGGHIISDYRPDSGDRFPFDRMFFESRSRISGILPHLARARGRNGPHPVYGERSGYART